MTLGLSLSFSGPQRPHRGEGLREGTLWPLAWDSVECNAGTESSSDIPLELQNEYKGEGRQQGDRVL